MALVGVKPAPREQKFHCDVIGDAFGQFDAGRVRDGARADFGQRKARMVGSDNHIGRERQFQPATAGNAVHSRDDGFVHLWQFLQATKAAHAVVAIDGVPVCGGLEVPPGAKELLAAGRQDRHAQFGIIAEVAKDFAHEAAGLQINRVSLGAVECDLNDCALSAGFHGGGVIAHGSGLSDEGVHCDGPVGRAKQRVDFYFAQGVAVRFDIGLHGEDGVNDRRDIGGGFAAITVQ